MKNSLFIIGVFSALLTNAVPADPGLLPVELKLVPEHGNVSEPLTSAGVVNVWNTAREFHVQVVSDSSQWLIRDVVIYVDHSELILPFELDDADAPTPVPMPLLCDPGDRDFTTYTKSYQAPQPEHNLVLDLKDELELTWGKPDKELRVQTVVVGVIFASVDGTKLGLAWALNPESGVTTGLDYMMAGIDDYQFSYECMHPRTGHFKAPPVKGLYCESDTHKGKTEDGGKFYYFPGERVEISIGNVKIGDAIAGETVSPLDIFPSSDTEDRRVINMARLLQSLDADASPKDGVLITEEVEDSLVSAMAILSIDSIDFADDEEIDQLIDLTITAAATYDIALVEVSAEDAKGNLDKNLDSIMFRKNVSKTEELASAKSKMNVMGVWFPAKKANGDPAVYTDENDVEQPGIAYYDANGDLLRVEQQAKPLVVVYCDAVEETGMHDVFSAISRDDGNTWKRKNVSRMADLSSFELKTGEEYYGHCKKPVFQVKGNKILIAWTSKFSRGGKPRFAIKTNDVFDTTDITLSSGENNTNDVYTFDDPYYEEDIWGISGPQLSVTYDDYPEIGEIPYSAVWTVRGLVLTGGDIKKAPFNEIGTNGAPKYVVGDIAWFKPERLTSARRDANQVFLGAADGAGFGLTWQEDPDGLQPGEAKGPGPGWGGALTSHKTDIWYSYLTWNDFAQVDTNFVSKGDPEHDNEDFSGRVKALVPMSLPVRISDNDTVNTENMMIAINEITGLPMFDEQGYFIPVSNTNSTSGEGFGAHRYGYMLEGLWNWNTNKVYTAGDNIDWEPGDGGALYAFTNQQGAVKNVVITADGRPLDGNTASARPNIFLQTYTKGDGTKSAWAIMAYVKTKGVGVGPDDEHGSGGDSGSGSEDGGGYDPYIQVPDAGKMCIYHSFDFQNPDLVSPGMILSLPETDTNGVPVLLGQVEYLGSTATTGADGNAVYTPIPNPDAGKLILDWKGDPMLAYENARRPRFILQSKTAAFGGFNAKGDYKEPNNSGTVLVVLYKEGEEGAGRQSDIIARRCVVKDQVGNIRKGNPWDPKNFLPHDDAVVISTVTTNINDTIYTTSVTNMVADTRAAVQNVSTMRPLEFWVNPERDDNAKGDGIKVCQWDQPEECRWWKSGVNPYEDARAHRGAIRGNYIIMGYSYTPNWAASRNAHDKYDFYIRRSFNGGETWTTDPAADESNVVVHYDYFINPEGVSGSDTDEEGNDISDATKHYMTTNSYAGGGVYEPARNVSLLKNNKVSVIEPRIVAVPGTIKTNGVWSGIDEDKQNVNVCYLAYGTSTNLKDVEKAPEDLFLSYTDDKGTTLYEDEWEVNPDSSGENAGEIVSGWLRLAKGDPEQGEVQIRMTPDGTRFYACWLEEGEEGSDIMFRRLMPSTFAVNVSTNVVEDPAAVFASLYEDWACDCFDTDTADGGQLDDYDGDGQCNVDEFIAGMNAANSASKFMVKKTKPVEDGYVVTWDAVEGRKYGIYWAEDLSSGFEPVATDLYFPQSSYTDTVHSVEESGFYYIDVQLAE